MGRCQNGGMALKPGSDDAELSMPADYDADHPEERPEMWGWHGEWGRGAVIGGWVSVVILLLFMTSTHYNEQGTLFLGGSAGILIIMLLIERNRRKKAYRK